eukprot:TRINITY_DN16281_c0_g1_i1.p2 TRINITY_DN16281_c0_g1~~TRINITY_DN16281_c0_g1_i1.p2  ORF type:complete len:101 (+),score=32.14 TRINITY_DN16281_c0_g1_i1:32-334(+)
MVNTEIYTILFVGSVRCVQETGGVGIYTTEVTDQIPEEYLKYCLKLASQGKLAYLIADDSLTYGMNFPINNLILTEDIVCLLYTSPSPRDRQKSRMPSSA